MSKNYENYVWKNGMPYGIPGKFSETSPSYNDIYYKIVSDPYHKRISIEKYVHNSFSQVIYDSALFNFRSLKPAEQNAWQKTTVAESETKITSHIRNQDDRLILIEIYSFVKGLCRECHSYSPHGILVSLQKMYYQSLGDAFNGTMLYDINEHPVLYKRYQVDLTTQDFTELLEEQWDMTKIEFDM